MFYFWDDYSDGIVVAMKKVYFGFEIVGAEEKQSIYDIAKLLKENQADLVTESILEEIFLPGYVFHPGGRGIPAQQEWKRDTDLINAAEIAVFEVSRVSTSIGYEVATAEARGIPVYCLYRPQEGVYLSGMVEGSPNLKVIQYAQTTDLAQPIAQILNPQD